MVARELCLKLGPGETCDGQFNLTTKGGWLPDATVAVPGGVSRFLVWQQGLGLRWLVKACTN